MLSIILFLHGRTCVTRSAATVKQAEAVVDQLITDVLQGRHGEGTFEIDAFVVDDHGLTVSDHFLSGVFDYPSRTPVKPAP